MTTKEEKHSGFYRKEGEQQNDTRMLPDLSSATSVLQFSKERIQSQETQITRESLFRKSQR